MRAFSRHRYRRNRLVPLQPEARNPHCHTIPRKQRKFPNEVNTSRRFYPCSSENQLSRPKYELYDLAPMYITMRLRLDGIWLDRQEQSDQKRPTLHGPATKSLPQSKSSQADHYMLQPTTILCCSKIYSEPENVWSNVRG
jgi:hypothetical protein